jgi:hypothetical protein
MRKLLLSTAATAALVTAAAAPAMAQFGFYVGPGGVGVGVGGPYYGAAPYYGGYYDYPYGYYDSYYGAPGVVVAPGWRYHRHFRHHWRY